MSAAASHQNNRTNDRSHLYGKICIELIFRQLTKQTTEQLIIHVLYTEMILLLIETFVVLHPEILKISHMNEHAQNIYVILIKFFPPNISSIRTLNVFVIHFRVDSFFRISIDMSFVSSTER